MSRNKFPDRTKNYNESEFREDTLLFNTSWYTQAFGDRKLTSSPQKSNMVPSRFYAVLRVFYLEREDKKNYDKVNF